MNDDEWLATVPLEIQNDTLWQTAVYRQAFFIGDIVWHDTSKLAQDTRTYSLSDQLYRATGGISATIAEGYGRISGKDQARYYEYALGSARESRDWYFKARHILGKIVVEHRLKLLEHIIRQLIAMIPKYRGKRIGEASELYNYQILHEDELFNVVPLP